MDDKQTLRKRMRLARRDHVAAQPDMIRALLFLRPPSAIAELVAGHSPVGLYGATAHEAPAIRYARWLYEAGHLLALPYFATRGGEMEFREWLDPFEESDLEIGPFGLMQPKATAAQVDPPALFVPLVAFTDDGHRLGQGGGHYDRWLAAHPDALAIGLAWDCQLVDELPLEPHDRPLSAIVTPTRLYGPF